MLFSGGLLAAPFTNNPVDNDKCAGTVAFIGFATVQNYYVVPFNTGITYGQKRAISGIKTGQTWSGNPGAVCTVTTPTFRADPPR